MKWKYIAVDASGEVFVYTQKPEYKDEQWGRELDVGKDCMHIDQIDPPEDASQELYKIVEV